MIHLVLSTKRERDGGDQASVKARQSGLIKRTG